jgi:hypothetical protein
MKLGDIETGWLVMRRILGNTAQKMMRIFDNAHQVETGWLFIGLKTTKT